MPKIENKAQDFVFGVLMVAIMVIFMVTYNITLQHGGGNMEALSIVAQAIWAPMIMHLLSRICLSARWPSESPLR